MTRTNPRNSRGAVARLDMIYSALSGPTRRTIIEQLRGGEATVSQLAAPHDMSLPAVSKHLRLLEDAGLVTRRVEGTTHFLMFNPKPLEEAISWIERQREFWRESLDHLAALVEKPEKIPAKTKKPNN
jgi:DNA-binding transcriptional ArsR family regulator